MKTRTIATLFLSPAVLATSTALAQAQAQAGADADTSHSDPVAVLLMVIGLIALLLGLRNLRELRGKRMTPPRTRSRQIPRSPGSKHKPPSDPPDSSDD